MIKTVLWFGLAWLYLIITSPLLIRIKYMELTGKFIGKNHTAYRYTRGLCRYLFKITRSRVKITGMENIPKSCPVLFASNHRSHMDNAVIHGFIDIPKGFVSITEAENIPILSKWMKHIKCIFIDRNNPRQSLKSLDECINNLKNGYSMVIYPEGRFTRGKLVDEFKKGCFKIAVRSGVPIMPVTIIGTDRIMSISGKIVGAAMVECIISKPVPTSFLTKNEERSLADNVRNIIIKNFERERQKEHALK